MATEVVELERSFTVGTTGWTAADLDNPQIDALWEAGSYEIVEGVLTRAPAATYDSSLALARLIRIADAAIAASDPDGELVAQVDLILTALRVAKVDAVYLSPRDRAL